MTNEIMKTNTGYVIPNVSNDVTEGIAEELNGLNISLDKVKIPAGGGLAFEVPGDDPDSPDSEKEIVGVIIDHYPLNSYWTEKYNGQNVAPSCYSTDSRTGTGTPGGDCLKCPYNKFGSGEDGQSNANFVTQYVSASSFTPNLTVASSPKALSFATHQSVIYCQARDRKTLLQGGELRPLSVLSLLSHMAYEITSFLCDFL